MVMFPWQQGTQSELTKLHSIMYWKLPEIMLSLSYMDNWVSVVTFCNVFELPDVRVEFINLVGMDFQNC